MADSSSIVETFYRVSFIYLIDSIPRYASIRGGSSGLKNLFLINIMTLTFSASYICNSLLESSKSFYRFLISNAELADDYDVNPSLGF
jgi:hypothetical protein